MRAGSPLVGAEYLKKTTRLIAYPALRKLPQMEWDDALARARELGFDTMEWMGIIAGIVFATYLLRFDADQAAALTLPVRYFIQFLCAVPLLALVVGPFYLRRTRRGLDQELERRHSHGPTDPQS
jgi:hypothetical protein